MIFRELVETELAMGITAAGHNPVPALPSPQDYWRYRPSSLVPPLEESPLCPPRSSTERSPCGCRGPAPARAPPVYPHVEWPSSPSPLLQEQPANDTEKQQNSRSSGAGTHPFSGHVKVRRSPNKRILADEVCLPVAANAGARPIFHEEVTPGHKDVAGGKCKVDLPDGHGVQPSYQHGNQSSGQGKTLETTLDDQINGLMLLSNQHRLSGQESAAFDQQKGREFSELKPEQPRLGNGGEQKARAHAFNGYMELCLSPSKQAAVEEISVPVAAKADISSALSFGEAATTGLQGAYGGEPKANMEDGLGMQPLGDIRNQSSGQSKAMESAMEGRTDKPARPPGQLRPVGQENASYNEQKKVEFSEPRLGNGNEQKARVHVINGYIECCPSPSKQTLMDETLVPMAAKANMSMAQSALSFGKVVATGHKRAFSEESKTNVVDGLGIQGDIRNQSSGWRKAMESAMEGRIDKPAQPPGQHRSTCQENAAYNEQKKVEFSELKPEQPRLGNGNEQKARVHAINDYIEYCPSPSKQTLVEETLVPMAAKANMSTVQSALSFGKVVATGHKRAFGGESKTNVVDGHGILGDIRNQSSGRRKAMESAMEGRTDKPARPPSQHRSAGQENAAYNEQKKVEFSESTTPERASNGLKRKPADSGPLIKKLKLLWEWNCPTCGVSKVSQHDLEEHLASQHHQLKVAALQSSRSDTAKPSTKAKLPVWDRITVKNTESSWGGGGNENVEENSGSQQQGRKPCAKPRAGLKSFHHRKDADAQKKADWKDQLYCKLCDVQCNSEKMLASHLGGKRHHERWLEGSG